VAMWTHDVNRFSHGVLREPGFQSVSQGCTFAAAALYYGAPVAEKHCPGLRRDFACDDGSACGA
jgi:hypothetical protein